MQIRRFKCYYKVNYKQISIEPTCKLELGLHVHVGLFDQELDSRFRAEQLQIKSDSDWEELINTHVIEIIIYLLLFGLLIYKLPEKKKRISSTNNKLWDHNFQNT